MPDPVGESYCYSNFGYCILGRIIEKVTGKSYIDFIRERFNIDVLVAGNTAEKLQSNESFYYDYD